MSCVSAMNESCGLLFFDSPLHAHGLCPQEARALRFLHAAAPGGAAPGLVRLLDTFQLGAHFCLVTGALCVAAPTRSAGLRG